MKKIFFSWSEELGGSDYLNKRTHWNIARLTVRKMEELFPEYKMARFKKIMFYLGTIEPDLSITQFIHPHFYEKSAEYIYLKIKKVQNKDKDGQFNAYELGKIVHYLCDFCCYAHISGGIGDVVDHIIYEYKINEYFIANYSKFDSEELYKIVKQSKYNDISYDIDTSIKEYKLSRPCYFIDIQKSIEISVTLLNVLCNKKLCQLIYRQGIMVNTEIV